MNFYIWSYVAVHLMCVMSVQGFEKCEDDDKDCSYWKEMGKCTSAPAHMYSCPKSCGKCNEPTTTKVPTTLPSFDQGLDNGSDYPSFSPPFSHPLSSTSSSLVPPFTPSSPPFSSSSSSSPPHSFSHSSSRPPFFSSSSSLSTPFSPPSSSSSSSSFPPPLPVASDIRISDNDFHSGSGDETTSQYPSAITSSTNTVPSSSTSSSSPSSPPPFSSSSSPPPSTPPSSSPPSSSPPSSTSSPPPPPPPPPSPVASDPRISYMDFPSGSGDDTTSPYPSAITSSLKTISPTPDNSFILAGSGDDSTTTITTATYSHTSDRGFNPTGSGDDTTSSYAFTITLSTRTISPTPGNGFTITGSGDDSTTSNNPTTTATNSQTSDSGFNLVGSGDDTTSPYPSTTLKVPPKTSPSRKPVDDSIECGTKALLGRIVGGQKAPLGHWPWQIGIKSCANCKFFCGGTIIKKRWVVTAAHCVLGYQPHELFVDGGVANQGKVSKYKQSFKCKEIHVHQRYGIVAQYDYDIALLKLDKDVFYNKMVRPLCLNERKLDVNQRCVVTGFGRTAEQGFKSSYLRQASVPIVAQDNCTRAYNATVPPKRVTDNMICAGFASGGIDSCQGDSGGPLSCYDIQKQKFVLGGIVSWGVGCARANHFGVYTDAQRLASWIQNITKNS